MKVLPKNLHRISIAPMMEVTNAHFRFFMRLLTKRATLWTEMVHVNTMANKPINEIFALEFHEIDHPIVCQLGGNDPE